MKLFKLESFCEFNTFVQTHTHTIFIHSSIHKQNWMSLSKTQIKSLWRLKPSDKICDLSLFEFVLTICKKRVQVKLTNIVNHHRRRFIMHTFQFGVKWENMFGCLSMCLCAKSLPQKTDEQHECEKWKAIKSMHDTLPQSRT